MIKARQIFIPFTQSAMKEFHSSTRKSLYPWFTVKENLFFSCFMTPYIACTVLLMLSGAISPPPTRSSSVAFHQRWLAFLTGHIFITGNSFVQLSFVRTFQLAALKDAAHQRTKKLSHVYVEITSIKQNSHSLRRDSCQARFESPPDMRDEELCCFEKRIVEENNKILMNKSTAPGPAARGRASKVD